jgi:hypothetical protein
VHDDWVGDDDQTAIQATPPLLGDSSRGETPSVEAAEEVTDKYQEGATYTTADEVEETIEALSESEAPSAEETLQVTTAEVREMDTASRASTLAEYFDEKAKQEAEINESSTMGQTFEPDDEAAVDTMPSPSEGLAEESQNLRAYFPSTAMSSIEVNEREGAVNSSSGSSGATFYYDSTVAYLRAALGVNAAVADQNVRPTFELLPTPRESYVATATVVDKIRATPTDDPLGIVEGSLRRSLLGDSTASTATGEVAVRDFRSAAGDKIIKSGSEARGPGSPPALPPRSKPPERDLLVAHCRDLSSSGGRASLLTQVHPAGALLREALLCSGRLLCPPPNVFLSF